MDKRTLFAFFLIAIVLILTPFYMKIVAPPQETASTGTDSLQVKPLDTAHTQAEPKTRTQSEQPPVTPVAMDTSSAGSKHETLDEEEIEVHTLLYDAVISSKNGGSIKAFTLHNYTMFDSLPVELITEYNQDNLLLTARSIDGLPLVLDHAWSVKSNPHSITLTNRTQSLTFSTTVMGHPVTKTLTFHPEDYTIEIDVDMTALRAELSQGIYLLHWNGGMPVTEKNLKDDLFYFRGYVYQAGDVVDPKLDKDEPMHDEVTGQTAWVAIRSKYFAAALIPDVPAQGALIGGEYEAGVPRYDVALQQQVTDNGHLTLYLGPLEVKRIDRLNADLDQIMTLGWAFIRPISHGVLTLLMALHKIIPNYGVVLILFAIGVKIVVYPLTRKSYQSMRKMSDIQPKVAELKEKHKNNPQQLNQATMKLYKEEGVNPLGGCLPILIQMPLLVALFQVFRSTIELRGEPFVLWIQDLSAPDTLMELFGFPINVLPLVMALTMLIQQRMTSAGGAGQQKQMAYIMNIVFLFIFYRFPSGLNLYYTLFNLLTILQQKYLTPHQPVAADASTPSGKGPKPLPGKGKQKRSKGRGSSG